MASRLARVQAALEKNTCAFYDVHAAIQAINSQAKQFREQKKSIHDMLLELLTETGQEEYVSAKGAIRIKSTDKKAKMDTEYLEGKLPQQLKQVEEEIAVRLEAKLKKAIAQDPKAVKRDGGIEIPRLGKRKLNEMASQMASEIGDNMDVTDVVKSVVFKKKRESKKKEKKVAAELEADFEGDEDGDIKGEDDKEDIPVEERGSETESDEELEEGGDIIEPASSSDGNMPPPVPTSEERAPEVLSTIAEMEQ